jgi:hypothetical protein
MVTAELDRLDRSELATRVDLRGQIGELRGAIGPIDGRSPRSAAASPRCSGRLDGVLGRQLLADVPLAFGVAALVLAATRLA